MTGTPTGSGSTALVLLTEIYILIINILGESNHFVFFGMVKYTLNMCFTIFLRHSFIAKAYAICKMTVVTGNQKK
jgi:hypothetical protein